MFASQKKILFKTSFSKKKECNTARTSTISGTLRRSRICSCCTAFTRFRIFADKNILGAGRGCSSAEYIYWKRLPLEHGTDQPQTLGKRVSDDLQLSIFQLNKKKTTPKKNLLTHICFRRTAFCWRFGLAKVGIGSSVVQNHCLGFDFQVCTMLHRRETSTFVFSTST